MREIGHLTANVLGFRHLIDSRTCSYTKLPSESIAKLKEEIQLCYLRKIKLGALLVID